MNQKIKTLLITSAVLFVFYIIGRQTAGILPQIASYGFEKLWFLSSAYLVLMILMQYALAEGWVALLRFNGAQLTRKQSYPTFFLPNLGKYIPGKVVFVLGRIELVHRYGGTRSIGVSSFAIENTLLIFSAAFLSLPIIHIFLIIPVEYMSGAVVLILVCWIIFIFIIPRISGLVLRAVPKHLKNDEYKPNLTWTNSFGLAIYYLLVWILYGAAGYFLASSLFEVNSVHIVMISSAFIASWLAGYLSFITPGGLGVREATLVILLTGILDPGEAGFLALISRFLWMLAEIGCSALFLITPSNKKE